MSARTGSRAALCSGYFPSDALWACRRARFCSAAATSTALPNSSRWLGKRRELVLGHDEPLSLHAPVIARREARIVQKLLEHAACLVGLAARAQQLRIAQRRLRSCKGA